MTSIVRWMTVTAAAAALVGCAMVKPEPSVEEMLTGTWKSKGSVAVYKIAFVDGKIQLTGHSEFSGKRLKILESSWDGEVLRFTSYLASTNTKVVHENRLTAPDTMVSAIVSTMWGASREQTVVWEKVVAEKE